MARRPVDTALFGYFLFQFISTLTFDTQGVYPAGLYPGWLRHLRANYLRDYKDVFIANAWRSPWYLAVCLVEQHIELPFYVYAANAYYNGALRIPQVLIPTIIYSVHTMTAILGIWLQALMADLTLLATEECAAPESLFERLKLCCVYFPFMVFSVIGLVDAIGLLHTRHRLGEASTHAHDD